EPNKDRPDHLRVITPAGLRSQSCSTCDGGRIMRPHGREEMLKRLLFATLFALALAGVTVVAQSAQSRAHVAAAKAAAGADFAGVFSRICSEATPTTPAQARPARGATPPRPAGPPPRDSWHAEPVKVFDNLYFVGQTEYSVWAVNTSAGIILIDSIFDY